LTHETIIVDNRVGSKELFKYFNNAELKRLDFADFAFLGYGVGGSSWMVGVERKVITDALTSMMNNRLSGHQLPGMLESYNRSYLIIEGIWRKRPGDELLEQYKGGRWRLIKLGKQTFPSGFLVGHILTIQEMLGIHVIFTSTPMETACWVSKMHKWWNNKQYDEHISHLKPQTPERAHLTNFSNVHKFCEFVVPGVGFNKAKSVAKNVRTLSELFNMSEKELSTIPKIGKILASRIYNGLRS